MHIWYDTPLFNPELSSIVRNGYIYLWIQQLLIYWVTRKSDTIHDKGTFSIVWKGRIVFGPPTKEDLGPMFSVLSVSHLVSQSRCDVTEMSHKICHTRSCVRTCVRTCVLFFLLFFSSFFFQLLFSPPSGCRGTMSCVACLKVHFIPFRPMRMVLNQNLMWQ